MCQPKCKPMKKVANVRRLAKDDTSNSFLFAVINRAALRWINMLMEKRMQDMQVFTVNLLPVLLRTLSDPSDAVVLLDLQVLLNLLEIFGSLN